MLYGLLGFFLAPYLLQKNMVEIMQQEFGAELRIDKIEINPFVLSLRINGLELDNPNDEPTVRIEEVFTNFQLSSLFRLALTFDEIRFTAPELYITREPSGNMDFAYLLSSNDDNTDDPVADEAAADKDDTSLLQALIFKFAIEDFIVHWTDQYSPDPVTTRFGPINIDVTELNTIPYRSGQQSVVITSESTGTLSWTGALQLNPLRSTGHARLEGSNFPLTSAYFRHQTGLEIVEGIADAELKYEVFTTNTGDIKVSITDLDMSFENVVINSFASGTGFDFAGEDQQILELPRVHLIGTQFHWPDQIVSLGSISIEEPRIDISRDASGVFNLEPRQIQSAAEKAGEVVTDSAIDADQQGSSGEQWKISIGNLAINGLALHLLDQTVSPDAKLGVTDFNLEISDISNLEGERFPTTLSLQALNGGKLTLQGEISVLPSPLFDFDLNVDALQLSGLQPYLSQQANLKLESGAINLAGHISNTETDPMLFGGDLEIVDFNISESIDNERLASWKRFGADNIKLSVEKRQLDISRIDFDRLYGDVLINEDGSLNVRKIKKEDPDADVKDSASESDAGDSDSKDAAPPMNIRIGGIALADASADFADLSLPLPFAVKVDSINGKMSTISTTSNEPSEVSFEGKVDEFGYARISGNVTPLQVTRNTDLVLNFENIDVPKFTPYSIPFAGREVTNGTLDLKLGYQVKDSQLVGDNSIVLSDFELGEKVPHPDAIDLPLGLAVALLKDVNGKIDIDLPVNGNVDDPEFSYGGVVLRALGNLLVKIVVSPFTALGSMLGMEASELEHVKFLDGRADLTPPEKEKATKLAQALAQRPELQLSIAGVYDASADGLAIRSARLDRILDQRIETLAVDGGDDIQYADQRRMALEQIFTEQMSEQNSDEKLEALRERYTVTSEAEDEANAEPTFDSLAYANAIRDQLIALQVVNETDLTALANARAESLETALLAVDGVLKERVFITDITTVTRADNESIMMKVTLSSAAD